MARKSDGVKINLTRLLHDQFHNQVNGFDRIQIDLAHYTHWSQSFCCIYAMTSLPNVFALRVVLLGCELNLLNYSINLSMTFQILDSRT